MSGLFSIVDGLGSQVKKLFTPSEVKIGNFLFTLHHQWTFVIILVGLVFASSNNYLNKEAMICKGGDSFTNNYCFLHGSAHVAKALAKETNGCVSELDEDHDDEKRTTHYYIWLPFVFAILAIMTKLPWILWKNIENEMMKKLKDDMAEDGKATAERIHKVLLRKNKRHNLRAIVYNYGFAFCELLNLVVVIVSMRLLNLVLNSEFANYGSNVQNYQSFVPNDRAVELTNPMTDPMCHLFPTEVSCSVKTGAIAGGANKENIICLLPYNTFYQYYFLILWSWYILLIGLTSIGLVYRLVQLLLPAFGKMRLNAMFDALGVSHENRNQVENLNSWETFLLARLVSTLKGSQVNKLLKAMEQDNPDNIETLSLIVREA